MITSSSISSLQPLTTTKWQIVTIPELSNQLLTLSQNCFTGRLDLSVENSSEPQWSLYFSLGNLIWATDRLHPLRRWTRQLIRHCPQLFGGQKLHLSHCPNYDLLAQLLRQGKIQKHEMEAIIEGQIIEILFDIMQWGAKQTKASGEQLTYRTATLGVIDSQLSLMSTEQAFLEAHKLWIAWQQAGLENYSPNLAPTILRAKKLQEQTSTIVYRNLTTHANGNQTLRDLAVKMNHNLLVLTKPIKSYIEQGLIGLTKVEDINCSIQTIANYNDQFTQDRQIEEVSTKADILSFQLSSNRHLHWATQSTAKAPNFLVAYIDDSKSDSLKMSAILSKAGYCCISIQDPVQALPILLEKKPDLIFLDLVMPIANGYEICTQIRRVSMFKDTPLIILTSNDGIVDRMRAKMVGASGFLAKPINAEKVMTTIQKHLVVSSKLTAQTSISTDLERNPELRRFGQKVARE
jgi:two-component system, chemotaxis family, response regulator PixG